jgi:hypothetical protein
MVFIAANLRRPTIAFERDLQLCGAKPSRKGTEGEMNNLGQNPWTPKEDDLLTKLAKSGESAAEIARHIDRNIASIRNRAMRLNIVLAKSRTLKLRSSK